MSDLGENFPIPYKAPEESASQKVLFGEMKIHEVKRQICSLKRQLEGAELSLKEWEKTLGNEKLKSKAINAKVVN